MGLTGPSREIVVEPLRETPPAPEPKPEREPVREPVPEPEKEPAGV
jgi:hypothetical protein